MKTKIAGGLAAAFLLLSTPGAKAQHAAPLVVGAAAPRSGPVLRQGTEIALATTEEMSSQSNRVGDRIRMEVTEAVTLNGNVVIPAGTPAVGEITLLRKKGMWGKSGRIEFRPLYVKVGERQIRLAANATRDKGKAGTAGVVASVAFLPVAGFFVTGTSAVIPPHTRVAAQIDEDLPVLFASR